MRHYLTATELTEEEIAAIHRFLPTEQTYQARLDADAAYCERVDELAESARTGQDGDWVGWCDAEEVLRQMTVALFAGDVAKAKAIADAEIMDWARKEADR